MSLWRNSLALRVTTFIVVGLFVLTVAPWLYLDWQMQRDLDAELQRIRDAGEPLTLVDAAQVMPPPSENAAELYQQVTGRIGADGLIHGQTAFEMSGYQDLVEKDYRDGKVTDAAVRSVFEDPAIVLALETLRQASEREKCAFPVNWSAGPAVLFPHWSKMRSATRWLSAKSKLCAHDGRIDEALDWARVSLRMSEHATQEPTLIAQLVAIACQSITCSQAQRTLNAGAPSPEAVGEMIAYLQSIDMRTPFRNSLIGERAMGLDCFEMVRRENPVELWRSWSGLSGSSGRHPTELLAALYASPLGRPFLNNDEIIYLQTMRDQIQITDTAAAKDRVARMEELEGSIPRMAVLSNMICPVFARAGQKRDQTIANLDLFEIALAAEVYHAERGEWPADLQALQDTLEYDLPEDPFAGAAYHYRREPDGFVAWSVGMDFDDDGGHGPKDAGYDWRNCDLVWKLAR